MSLIEKMLLSLLIFTSGTLLGINLPSYHCQVIELNPPEYRSPVELKIIGMTQLDFHDPLMATNMIDYQLWTTQTSSGKGVIKKIELENFEVKILKTNLFDQELVKNVDFAGTSYIKKTFAVKVELSADTAIDLTQIGCVRQYTNRAVHHVLCRQFIPDES